ncbi:ankyrin repeat domain-containing protein [Actinoplanes awajinensis]|uniref:ankyrin repeat domain-containing protein n=1 Tax=Actinoplanes awajinensis TaxID=135946 RepID=UPI000AF6D73A|nr:ankyrin repeat domain-containing protein [Actinoplanes awajinensis]
MVQKVAVIEAAREGDLLTLRQLLDEDAAAVGARGWMDETALHVAAKVGSAGAVRMLLDAGADPLARRTNQDTPLHWATTGAVAALLLQAVHSPDHLNEFGQTPLHRARDPEVVTVLLRGGASLTARDFQGDTPLHKAGAAKARLLLDAGAELEARNGRGETPLHRAVWEGDDVLVALLLAEGANPVVRDRSGSSPHHLARSRGPEEVRVRLAAAGGSLLEPTDPVIVIGSAQSALWTGRRAVSVAGHATLVRWRLDRTPQPEVIMPTEHTAIHDLAVHPRRPLIAVAPVDAPVELRGDDLADPELLGELTNVSALAFSPDGRWLAAALDPERVVLLDLDTRTITADVEAGERIGCVDFSPDGTLLATTCSFQAGAHVRVDRVTARGGLEPVTEIKRAARDTIPAAVFAPDNRYLVVWETSGIDHSRPPGWRADILLTDTDGFVIWQRSVDAEITGVATPQLDWFTRPCFSADGAMIAIGFDGVVVLLRTNDGATLAVVPVGGDARSVAVCPVTGGLVAATDRGLRRIEVTSRLGRAMRRLLRGGTTAGR